MQCISPIDARQRFGAKQRLSIHVTEATDTCYNKKITGNVIFYADRVLSTEVRGSPYHRYAYS
jgi:hypothetical protein